MLNISGYGYLPGYCVQDHAIEGEKGIFFARHNRLGYPVAQNVNVQRSMSAVDSKTLRKVIQATELSIKKPSIFSGDRGSRLPRGGCPMITLLLR